MCTFFRANWRSRTSSFDSERDLFGNFNDLDSTDPRLPQPFLHFWELFAELRLIGCDFSKHRALSDWRAGATWVKMSRLVNQRSVRWKLPFLPDNKSCGAQVRIPIGLVGFIFFLSHSQTETGDKYLSTQNERTLWDGINCECSKRWEGQMWNRGNVKMRQAWRPLCHAVVNLLYKNCTVLLCK